jgi:S-adenosylmethionine hydrolase
MPIITLISDWNQSDYYLPSVKGILMGSIPDIQIVDISHQIKSFGIIQAAYILKESYPNFPENTIHLICVNSVSENGRYLVVEHEKQFFICADNGIAGLLFETLHYVWLIEVRAEELTSFPEAEIFTKIATELILNKFDASKLASKNPRICTKYSIAINHRRKHHLR